MVREREIGAEKAVRGADQPAAGAARTRRWRRDSGQSLIELILVLPLLLLVLFGILEFANAWRTYQVITNSGREGAREAVIGSSNDATVQAVVDSRLQAGGLTPADATVRLAICSETGPTTSCTGQPDTVEISYPFQFRMIGPIADLICGNDSCGDDFGSVTLFTRTVMRNE